LLKTVFFLKNQATTQIALRACKNQNVLKSSRDIISCPLALMRKM